MGILLLVRQKHARWVSNQSESTPLLQVDVSDLTEFLPDSNQIEPWNDSSQSRAVLNEQNQPIANLIQTMPASRSIVGYLGPTNLLVVVSPQDSILSVKILNSADTIEHVNTIRDSDRFLNAFRGLRWSRPEQWPPVDAVSGATLTSYAIIQSISARAGREIRQLKFPTEITPDEVASLFNTDADVVLKTRNSSDRGDLLTVTTEGQGETNLGYLVRTSPSADSLVGYQGPTDTLLALDPQMRFLAIQVRASYDNEPYVEYVQEDRYLAEILQGTTLSEISNLSDDSYEGVSGATMTSLNVWDGIRLAADEISHAVPRDPTNESSQPFIQLNWRDLTTITVCLFGIVMGVSRLRRKKKLRFGFLILVIVYLGFVAGDMLSQAVIVGWSQNGLPISVAPGLVILCIAAIMMPVLSKHNVYCTQLCPMGAIQQVSKNRVGRRVRLPAPATRLLKTIPIILLVFTLLVAFRYIDLNLASIEAFDAFAFRVAGWATLVIATVGFTVSLFVPMAYCRFGCPTGRLLNYLRFNSRSGRLQGGDFLLMGAIGLGLLI